LGLLRALWNPLGRMGLFGVLSTLRDRMGLLGKLCVSLKNLSDAHSMSFASDISEQKDDLAEK